MVLVEVFVMVADFPRLEKVLLLHRCFNVNFSKLQSHLGVSFAEKGISPSVGRLRIG